MLYDRHRQTDRQTEAERERERERQRYRRGGKKRGMDICAYKRDLERCLIERGRIFRV